MVGKMSLDGTWKIKGIDGRRGGVVPYCAAEIDERTFLDARVPGEVHLDLMRHGQIGEQREGMNALAARWVEEQFWIYRRTFNAPAEALSATAWLVFEGLDLVADVYLNGVKVGTHANTFRPCRIDVTGKLLAGENQLTVCLDSGLHYAGDLPAEEYDPRHADETLYKRMWQRKPQYQFGWDWNPRLVNVGIFLPCRLEWAESARIDQLTVYPDLAADHSSATLHVRAQVDNVTGAPLDATLRLTVTAPDGATLAASAAVTLPAGQAEQALAIDVDQPQLWWPRPHGDQPLYQVRCEVQVAGQVVDAMERRTGIRSIRINQDPHPVEGNYFILEVNGEPVFCKGGNWVPVDMIYADVTKERYQKLVDLAVAENFNTLRVWGGGLYLDHDMLDICDEAGILIWHDCIFACSQYPSGDAGFLREVRAEITHVVRELSPHPSLAVWCGNNEIEWGEWDWGYENARAHPDHALYHLEIPRIVHTEDPSRPYWPSSPYSPDAIHPNSTIIGDQHPWHVSLGVDDDNFWAYRGDDSRFPNEGGALGASAPATLRQFMPEDEQYYLSPSWEYHDNEMEQRAPGLMTERWFDTWFGLKPADLDLETYAFYSAVLQSEALLEYVNNFRRRMFSTASAIFWMYNDSWPVTHGWTTVDYYLRRKLAYHPVRRVFEPVNVIVAVEGEQVLVVGVNDTLAPWKGEVRYGLARFDGAQRSELTAAAELAPNSATLLATFALDEWKKAGYDQAIAYATLWQGGRLLRMNRQFMAPYKDIAWSEPHVTVRREGDEAVFESDVYAWGVCLDPDGILDVSDDLFDLLPGVAWRIPWPADRPLPSIERIANYRRG